MKFDYRMIIIIVAILLFYLRLIALQWGKSKQLRSMQTQAKTNWVKNKKNKGKTQPPPPPAQTLSFRVTNWYVVGLGIFLIAIGAVVYGTNLISLPIIKEQWWIGIVAGVVLLAFSFH